MMHTFGLAIITAVSVGLCSYLAALGHNIGKAKRSGFNYVVVRRSLSPPSLSFFSLLFSALSPFASVFLLPVPLPLG